MTVVGPAVGHWGLEAEDCVRDYWHSNREDCSDPAGMIALLGPLFDNAQGLDRVARSMVLVVIVVGSVPFGWCCFTQLG